MLGGGNGKPLDNGFRRLFLGKTGNAPPVDACADAGCERSPTACGHTDEPPVPNLVIEQRGLLLHEPIPPPDGFRHDPSLHVEPAEQTVRRWSPSEVPRKSRVDREPSLCRRLEPVGEIADDDRYGARARVRYSS